MKTRIDGVDVEIADKLEDFKLLINKEKTDDSPLPRNIAIEIKNVYFYIRCIEFLHERTGHDKTPLIFRGHKNSDFSLTPSIMRSDQKLRPQSSDIDKYEEKIMFEFQRHARPFLDHLPREDVEKWEWLALAQHHYLPTRLLDWTYKAGTALFFAVDDSIYGYNRFNTNPLEGDDCSCVWAITPPNEIDIPTHDNPSKITDVYTYTPPHIAPRITMQQGCFTVHPSNYCNDLHQWIKGTRVIFFIKQENRNSIKSGLHSIGINRATLFPGLDGIANQITETIRRAY